MIQLPPQAEEIVEDAKCFVKIWCVFDLAYTTWFWWLEPRLRGVKSPWREYVRNVSIMAAEVTIVRKLH